MNQSSSHPLYCTWTHMISRCEDRGTESYPRYGGRGIGVCKRWRESFAAFAADMGMRPSPKHSIDRINPNGNYEPGNCRWATPKEQARNKRRNLLLSAFGVTRCAAEWSELMGINSDTLRARLFILGWSVEKTLLTPAARRRLRANSPNSEPIANAEKTHCSQGHPYTEENLYRRSNGRRECRTCRNELKRLARAEAQEARDRK